VSEAGRRCRERRFLEFDHVRPFARAGETTAENLRLRCRAHNQFAAERVYGVAFMNRKREEAKAASILKEQETDLTAGLRNLGYKAEIVRSAVEHVMQGPAMTLEERMREALAFLRPRARTVPAGT
jgi:Holliday junction resolvasome RuvABC DNA-binding subunit